MASTTKPDILLAAQARVMQTLADVGGDRDAALLLLAMLLEAALIGASAGFGRDPPSGRG